VRKQRISLKASAALLALLWPSLALAVMPAWVYEQARENSHASRSSQGAQCKGSTKDTGRMSRQRAVMRIFRDTIGKLAEGTPLEFTVSCHRAGDPTLIGGTLWADYDRLMKAKYLEVFLNSDETGYNVALWQSHVIDAPTEKPTWEP
jgi:hypothetical protein